MIGRVVPRSYLEEAKKRIILNTDKISQYINQINGNIEILPDKISALETSLQTNDGITIRQNLNKKVEELQVELNNILKIINNNINGKDINFTENTNIIELSSKEVQE